jgi:hypothetical protein
MAQDPRTGRSRRPGDPANMPAADEDATLSQAASNLPLPPFAPPDPAVPPAAGAYLPVPPSPAGGAPGQVPAVGQQAGQSGISMAWAVLTTFVFMFTSVILLVILAANTANAKNGALVGWTIAIVVVFNLLYAALALSLARRSAGQPGNWSFFSPVRRP